MNGQEPEQTEKQTGVFDELLTPKRIVLVVGGLIAIILLGVLLSSLGGGDPADEATPTTGVFPTIAPSDDPGHEIPPLGGCALIPSEDVGQALGIPENASLVQFSGGESCTWQTTDDDPSIAGRSVQLAPGSPSAFEPDAVVNGVAGVPVSDVGDVAVWFGGDEIGTLSAVAETDSVYLFMNLSIDRLDVTDGARLESARELMRSAIDMVISGPPEPIAVDLCDLVTDDEAETLLGPHRTGRAAARNPAMISDNYSDVVNLREDGEFECTRLIFTEIYVKVTTSLESDFEEGANIDGVPGIPVAAIGDGAMWFDDVPVSGPFASLHEMDVMAVTSGDARFRIVLALPDLSPDEQFEAMKILASRAVSRLPGASGPVIVVEPETVDTSNLGFVDNLMAREADGEWTYEEGLIATLRLFSGGAEDAEVLRTDELVDYSGTGIISLAHDYLDTAEDGPARDEVARLLEELVPNFGETEPEVEAAGAAFTLFSPNGILLPVLATLGDEEEPPDEGEAPEPEDGEDRGYAPPSDDIPFDYPDAPPGPGECAQFEQTLAGWEVSGYEIPDHGPWAGAVLFPVPGQEDGWNRETHLLWALQALTDSISEYGTPPICIRLLLSHHGGSHTFVEQRLDPSLCLVFVNKPMQGRDRAEFRQQLAADIAHCYFPFVFIAQYDVTYLERRWWNHALAEFLSNVVYPGVNLEWRLSPALAAQEISSPLVERGAGNWMFFQEVMNAVGKEGIARIIKALPGGDNPILDEITLAGLEGMDEFYHTFSQHLTDVDVDDSGGGSIPYQPPKIPKSISGPGTLKQDLVPFQATRWEVTVPSGQFACLTGQKSDQAMVSYREGSVGADGGGWQELAEAEVAIDHNFVVVATGLHDGEHFSLVVRDVHDEADCEDEEDEPEQTTTTFCECDPSDYFLVWQDIPELLQELLTPPS